MKQVISITAIGFLAMSFASCSKTPGFTGANVPPGAQTSKQSPDLNFASDWISFSSYLMATDRLGRPIATGVYPFTAASNIQYDKSTHVELAYCRMPSGQRTPYVYKRLPYDFSIDADRVNSSVSLGYSIGPDAFNVYFQDAAPVFLAKAVDISTSEDWRFRYVVLPKAKYETMNIDWDDLSAVASALNFSL